MTTFTYYFTKPGDYTEVIDLMHSIIGVSATLVGNNAMNVEIETGKPLATIFSLGTAVGIIEARMAIDKIKKEI